MNRIYRVIWSRIRRAWVVASELATPRRKGAGNAVGSPVFPGTIGASAPRALPRVGILAATLAAAFPAFAEERYWDVNTTSVGLGGTGVWDDTSPLWGTANGVAGPYVSWDNAALDDAFFQGVAGTVTLGGPITAHDLTLKANNYRLTGGTLTLGGAAPTITVVGSTRSTTIDSAIAGTSGLVKSGAGALHLGGVNTFSGGIALDGGSLFAATDAALGDPANAIVTAPGSAVRLSILGATPTARTVSIGTEGTLTLHGVAAGTAEITGDGNVVVDTGVTMDSDASTYTGTTTFRACNGVCTTYFT